MNTTQPSTVRRIALAGILLAGAVVLFVLATRDAHAGTPVVQVRSAGVDVGPANVVEEPVVDEGIPTATTVLPDGAVIDAAPLIVARSSSPSSTTTAPAPVIVAQPVDKSDAPELTVGQRTLVKVWTSDPRGDYCAGTSADDAAAMGAPEHDARCDTSDAGDPDLAARNGETPAPADYNPLTSLYGPGTTAQPHEGSSGSTYPACWTGCAPSSTSTPAGQ